MPIQLRDQIIRRSGMKRFNIQSTYAPQLVLGRPVAVSVLAALLLAAPLALSPQLALSQAVHLVEVDVKIVGAGYRTSKLLESTVYNDTDEKIGELDDIILSPDG